VIVATVRNTAADFALRFVGYPTTSTPAIMSVMKLVEENKYIRPFSTVSRLVVDDLDCA